MTDEVEEIEGFKWTKDVTIMLIEYIDENFIRIESGVKKIVYQEIAKKINDAFDTKLSYEQVDSKWKGLKRTYTKMKEQNKSTGQLKKGWNYYSLMDAIFTRERKYQASYFSLEDSSNAEGFKWTKDITLTLIGAIKENFHQLENGVKKITYQEIANTLNSTYGTNLSYEQVDSKWKGLKKVYRRLKEESGPAEQPKRTWYFYHLIDEILDETPDVKPPPIFTSEDMFFECTVTEDEIDPLNEKPTSPSSRKRRRTSIGSTSSDDPVERRHRERMDAMNRFLDLFEKMVNKM